jgi:hypothetical protein
VCFTADAHALTEDIGRSTPTLQVTASLS